MLPTVSSCVLCSFNRFLSAFSRFGALCADCWLDLAWRLFCFGNFINKSCWSLVYLMCMHNFPYVLLGVAQVFVRSWVILHALLFSCILTPLCRAILINCIGDCLLFSEFQFSHDLVVVVLRLGIYAFASGIYHVGIMSFMCVWRFYCFVCVICRFNGFMSAFRSLFVWLHALCELLCVSMCFLCVPTNCPMDPYVRYGFL